MISIYSFRCSPEYAACWILLSVIECKFQNIYNLMTDIKSISTDDVCLRVVLISPCRFIITNWRCQITRATTQVFCRKIIESLSHSPCVIWVILKTKMAIRLYVTFFDADIDIFKVSNYAPLPLSVIVFVYAMVGGLCCVAATLVD